MTTAAERSRLANRIWLPSYLEGVPAEIDPDRYRSLAEVFRASVQKYRNRTAYVGIGTEMTYGECEALATHFAACPHRSGCAMPWRPDTKARCSRCRSARRTSPSCSTPATPPAWPRQRC